MRRRTAGIITTLGLVAGLGMAGWQVQSQAEPAFAEIGQCPPGTIPGPSNDNPVWTDNNVAVYAGRDFASAASAAEVEGVLVVEGDADISKTNGGRFNVGWVGVGSGVVPSPGSVMLAVGGDLRVHDGVVLDVGARATSPSGDGGSVTVSVPVGSVCTVTETTPETPSGGVWDAAVISPATFTVDAAGTEVAVTVTNTLRPATPVEPVEPADPGTSGLPSTGGTVPWWAIAAGGVLVVGGAGALLIAGRRRRRG